MIEHMPGLKYELSKYDKCCGFLSFIDKNHDLRIKIKIIVYNEAR